MSCNSDDVSCYSGRRSCLSGRSCICNFEPVGQPMPGQAEKGKETRQAFAQSLVEKAQQP